MPEPNEDEADRAYREMQAEIGKLHDAVEHVGDMLAQFLDLIKPRLKKKP